MKKIFIHIPKNGGMSLRHDTTLKKHILLAEPRNHKSPEYTKAVLETMYKNGDHHGWQHARWRDLNPDLITTTEAFAIVRNPCLLFCAPRRPFDNITRLKILRSNFTKGFFFIHHA